MARRTDLDEAEEWEDVLLLEPREMFDDCLIGLIHQGGWRRALYSRRLVIEALVADGMDEGDAIEHYDFNVSGSMGTDFAWFLYDETIEPVWQLTAVDEIEDD